VASICLALAFELCLVLVLHPLLELSSRNFKNRNGKNKHFITSIFAVCSKQSRL